MRGHAALLVLLLAPTAATAQMAAVSSTPAVQPARPPTDARVRMVVYDPRAVVPLIVAPNHELAVLFSSGERIGSVAVGDSGSWQVSATKAGDSLFVKPVGAATPTNMTVITDARVYLFDLAPGYGGEQAYVVRFSYPLPPEATETAAAARPAAGSYRTAGARQLRPIAIHDDGLRTYIAWPADRPLPAVFADNGAGEETLVDGYMRNGVLTIDRVYGELIFRLDGRVARAVRR